MTSIQCCLTKQLSHNSAVKISLMAGTEDSTHNALSEKLWALWCHVHSKKTWKCALNLFQSPDRGPGRRFIHLDSQVSAYFLFIHLYTATSWPVFVPLCGFLRNTRGGISKPSTGLRPSMARASFQVDASRRHPSKHTSLAPPLGSKLP